MPEAAVNSRVPVPGVRVERLPKFALPVVTVNVLELKSKPPPEVVIEVTVCDLLVPKFKVPEAIVKDPAARLFVTMEVPPVPF